MTARANQIKDYLGGLFGAEDEVLLAVKKNAKEAGLPNIHVSSTVGKLLYCLAMIHRPLKVLEIGTLAGYSAIWLARALPPEGKIISLECYPEHAALARKNIAFAGFENRVEVREGMAGDLMEQMIQKGEGPFDMVFIDADKENYLLYLDKAIQLSRPGTLILGDNLIPKEDELHPHYSEPKVIYRFNQQLATDKRLESILVPTLRNNGRIDALGIAIVK